MAVNGNTSYTYTNIGTLIGTVGATTTTSAINSNAVDYNPQPNQYYNAASACSTITSLGISAGTIFMTNPCNTVIKTTDQGATLTWAYNLQAAEYVYVTPQAIYINAFNWNLYKSTDGGKTFGFIFYGPNYISSVEFYGVAAFGSKVYEASTNGLLISSDGGTTFSTVALNGKNLPVGAVNVDANGFVYASIAEALCKSVDNGVSFNCAHLGTAGASIFGTDIQISGNNVFVSTQFGLEIFNDGGLTFNNVVPGSTPDGTVVNKTFISGSTLYVATNWGVGVSQDNGNTFTFLTTADGLPSNHVNAVLVNGGYLYVGTTAGFGAIKLN